MNKVRGVLLRTSSTWCPSADAIVTCDNFLTRVQMSISHHACITAGGMVAMKPALLFTIMSFVVTYLTILLKIG